MLKWNIEILFTFWVTHFLPTEKPKQPQAPPKPVQNGPVFVYSPASHTAAEIGDPMKLTAQISGNPSPKVHWIKVHNNISLLILDFIFSISFILLFPESVTFRNVWNRILMNEMYLAQTKENNHKGKLILCYSFA